MAIAIIIMAEVVLLLVKESWGHSLSWLHVPKWRDINYHNTVGPLFSL